MSRLTFACKWQNRFWDNEPIVAHFPSNKGGTLDIQIPHSSSEMHPTPCMHNVCRMRGLGSSLTLKQNVLSLILLIPLVKLTNQKRGICRHRILYPLRLEPLFPNDTRTLRPKASLEPNQILNWLKVCLNGKCNLLNKQNLFLVIKWPKWPSTCVHGPKHAYTGTFLHTQLRFQKYKKCKFSAIMVEVWNESHIAWEPFHTPFFNYIKPYMVPFQNTEIPREKPKIH